MQLYVQAKSKKDLNTRLANGERIYGIQYGFQGNADYRLDDLLPSGTVIKIWEKAVDGTPITKAYGTWDGPKHRVK